MRISDLLAQLLKVYFTGNKTILFKQIALVAYFSKFRYDVSIFWVKIIVFVVTITDYISPESFLNYS
jgi:hypothetical protein